MWQGVLRHECRPLRSVISRLPLALGLRGVKQSPPEDVKTRKQPPQDTAFDGQVPKFSGPTCIEFDHHLKVICIHGRPGNARCSTLLVGVNSATACTPSDTASRLSPFPRQPKTTTLLPEKVSALAITVLVDHRQLQPDYRTFHAPLSTTIAQISSVPNSKTHHTFQDAYTQVRITVLPHNACPPTPPQEP